MARGRPATPLGTWGEIHTKQLDTGRWQAETRLRLWNGDTARLQARGKSRTAATNSLKEKCADRLGATDTKELTTTSKVANLLQEWIDTKGKLRPQTKERYQRAIDRHIIPAFGNMRLNEVTPAFLNSWIHSKPAGTVGNIRSVLKGAFGMALRFGLVPADPMQAVEAVAETPTEVRALTRDEIPRFRDAIAKSGNDTLIDVTDLVLSTGLRAGEALALRWEDVDLETSPPVMRLTGTMVHSKETGYVRQAEGKTATATRVIQLPALAVEIFQRRNKLFGALEMVFPSGAGTYVWPQNLNRWLREWRGEEFTWVTVHALRKTLASLVADELGPAKAADVLGHADSRLTERVYYMRTRTGVPIGQVVDEALGLSKKSPNNKTI